MAVHRGRIDLLEDHLRRNPDLLTRTFSHQEIYPPALGCQRMTLVDKGEWQAGIAAAVLAGDPLHAPLLLTDGGSIPGATSGTLGRLKPPGEALSKGAQVILVGEKPPAPCEGRFTKGMSLVLAKPGDWRCTVTAS